MQRFLLLIFFCFGTRIASASSGDLSDSVRMTLQQAEQQFLSKNYNVEASRALIIQARLWNNPNLSVSQGVYNPNTGKYFETSASEGEESAEFQQLILLAGKRKKQIRIAQTGYLIAEDQLYDLLNTLKFTLRSDFYNMYYQQLSARVYDEQISALKDVVIAFGQQQANGYIAETEVVRIKAQLYSLQSEYNDLVNQINDVESEFRLLIAEPGVYIMPEADSARIAALNPRVYLLQTLLDSAMMHRTDLKIGRDSLLLNQQNYSYQKALAVPDMTLGVGYDKNGSYIHNFNSLSLSFDLPFFNRNQGNIRYARNLIDFSDMQLKSTVQAAADQVSRSLEKAIAADSLYHSVDPRFSGEFDRLAREVLINYRKRNISILDFLDFYDSYKENILQINTILYNRLNTMEQINYVTGTNFFTY
jgi:cobalt-zinc-cadmium efflux system outer membrane protein